jgi:hypothetical protein
VSIDDHLQALIGVWRHSHEEDHGGCQVFRPGGFDLPPSRGRAGFALRPDGTAVETRPGADDRPTGVAGRWTAVDNQLQILSADGARRSVYTIEGLESDKLTLRPVS